MKCTAVDEVHHSPILPPLSPFLSLDTHLSKGPLPDERLNLVALHPHLPRPHSVVVVLIVPFLLLALLKRRRGRRRREEEEKEEEEEEEEKEEEVMGDQWRKEERGSDRWTVEVRGEEEVREMWTTTQNP